MKKLLAAILMLSVTSTFSQIQITKTDMPLANDTVRISSAATVGSIDYHLTGVNYTWDFSTLIPLSQKVDTFVSVTSTPFVYQFYFNNSILYPKHKATVAFALPNPQGTTGVTITNMFGYYKALTGEYTQVGFGANINGIPTSVKFDSIDVIYKLPMNYGNPKDSCRSKYTISVPGLGYYGQKKKRLNEIDGWGTLITPYGTFPALRVKTKIDATDTIFSTQFGMGFNTPRPTQYEYKWLGTNGKEPYLTVVTQMVGSTETVVNVTYRDKFNGTVPQQGIGELDLKESDVVIYPNPSNNGVANLQYALNKNANVSVEIYNALGARVGSLFNGLQTVGVFNAIIDKEALKLPSSVYFIKVKADDKEIVKKLILE